MNHIIGIFLISLGALFNLSGCVGLLRFSNVFSKIQAASKSVTLGTTFILIGIAFTEGISVSSTKALLTAGLILFTVPTGAHALARASREYSKTQKESDKGKENETPKT